MKEKKKKKKKEDERPTIKYEKGKINLKWCKSAYTAQKMDFPLRISSANVAKIAVFGGFGHIYWRYP